MAKKAKKFDNSHAISNRENVVAQVGFNINKCTILWNHLTEFLCELRHKSGIQVCECAEKVVFAVKQFSWRNKETIEMSGHFMIYFLDLFHMQNGIFQKTQDITHITNDIFHITKDIIHIITGITHIIKDPSPELPCPTWNLYYINTCIYLEGKIHVKLPASKHLNKFCQCIHMYTLRISRLYRWKDDILLSLDIAKT
jgi:hypothetical protein